MDYIKQHINRQYANARENTILDTPDSYFETSESHNSFTIKHLYMTKKEAKTDKFNRIFGVIFLGIFVTVISSLHFLDFNNITHISKELIRQSTYIWGYILIVITLIVVVKNPLENMYTTYTITDEIIYIQVKRKYINQGLITLPAYKFANLTIIADSAKVLWMTFGTYALELTTTDGEKIKVRDSLRSEKHAEFLTKKIKSYIEYNK